MALLQERGCSTCSKGANNQVLNEVKKKREIHLCKPAFGKTCHGLLIQRPIFQPPIGQQEANVVSKLSSSSYIEAYNYSTLYVGS